MLSAGLYMVHMWQPRKKCRMIPLLSHRACRNVVAIKLSASHHDTSGLIHIRPKLRTRPRHVTEKGLLHT